MRQMKITQTKTEPLVSFILFKPDPKSGFFHAKKMGDESPKKHHTKYRTL